MASCRLDDLGPCVALRPSPARGDRRSARPRWHARPCAKRCFPCHSPYPSTLDRQPAVRVSERQSSFVEEFWSPSHVRLSRNPQAKANAISPAHFNASARGSFSLRRGLDSNLGFLQAEHHPSFSRHFTSETTKATPSGRPHMSCYAARLLADAPPCEGTLAIVPAERRRIDFAARGRPGGVRRLGKARV